MVRIVAKSVVRTVSFLRNALMWRQCERQYALIAWGLMAGWIVLLPRLPGDPAGAEGALAALGLSALLAAVCAIDARRGIIPDSFVVLLAVGGLIHLAWTDGPYGLQRLLEAGFFLLAAWLFRAAFRYVRGYHGLGLGDVKFATAGVLWIGIAAVPALLIVAVLSTTASLLILNAGGHALNRRQAIPFGPHLAIALWSNWIAGLV